MQSQRLNIARAQVASIAARVLTTTRILCKQGETTPAMLVLNGADCSGFERHARSAIRHCVRAGLIAIEARPYGAAIRRIV